MNVRLGVESRRSRVHATWILIYCKWIFWGASTSMNFYASFSFWRVSCRGRINIRARSELIIVHASLSWLQSFDADFWAFIGCLDRDINGFKFHAIACWRWWLDAGHIFQLSSNTSISQQPASQNNVSLFTFWWCKERKVWNMQR